MEKIYLLLLVFPFLFSCSSDDEKPEEPKTIVILENQCTFDYTNTVMGYFDKNGYCHKIADLGDIQSGHRSKEVIINDESIKEVVFFAEFFLPQGIEKTTSRRIVGDFLLNSLEINLFFSSNPEDDNCIGPSVLKDDPTQYPH